MKTETIVPIIKENKTRAFTLIESLICLAIVGVIAAAIYHVSHNERETKVIDGCEYLQTWNGHGYNLTHKGNCTNQFHKLFKQ